jgi:hypothetical protein
MAAEPAVATEAFRGTLAVIKVGGIETPVRQAVQIGERKFEVAGSESLLANLFALEGQSVEVQGIVTHLFYIGGEGYPLLTVVTVKVAQGPDAQIAVSAELFAELARPDSEPLIVAVTPKMENGRISERAQVALAAFLADLAADGLRIEVLKTKSGGPEVLMRGSKKAIQAIIDRGQISAIRLVSTFEGSN